MRIIQSKTETVKIDSLRPHPRNPREGDIGAIHQSINNNGFYGSILAQQSTGFILAGNHRWQAMLQAGATEIPVTWIDVDDDHALRILLADNRTRFRPVRSRYAASSLSGWSTSVMYGRSCIQKYEAGSL